MEYMRSVYTCGLVNDALPDENGRRTMMHVYNLIRDEQGYFVLTCHDLATGQEIGRLDSLTSGDEIHLFLDAIEGGYWNDLVQRVQ